MVDDHWMGDGRSEASADDIRRALRLYRVADRGAGAVVAALALLLAHRARLSRVSTSRWAAEMVGQRVERASSMHAS